jgi:protein dithiol:quinone oxidoreductase
MKHYPAVSWPWFGLVVALALLAQEALLKMLGDAPSLAQTSYRILVMTIGVTSLALLILPRRRLAYLLGFFVCAALMAWALYMQYGLGLDPCPLCSVQRVAVIAMGVIFLVAAIHDPGRVGAMVYAGLTVVIGGFGMAVAARHVWIQSLPKGSVPSCGMGLDYMLETLPFTDVISKVLAGSGECAEEGWKFMQLAIPSWTFVFFVAMMVASIALIRRD